MGGGGGGVGGERGGGEEGLWVGEGRGEGSEGGVGGRITNPILQKLDRGGQ